MKTERTPDAKRKNAWLRAYARNLATIRGSLDKPDHSPRKWSPTKFRVLLAKGREDQRIKPVDLYNALRVWFYDRDLPSLSTIYRWQDKRSEGPRAHLLAAVALALKVPVEALTDPVKLRSKPNEAGNGDGETSGAAAGTEQAKAG